MKDDEVYLKHIRDAILTIESFTDGLLYEEFLEDKLTQNGVIRELEIIGEATKNLSSDFRDHHPDIPWKDMAGMRDKLIHGYMMVDLDPVWKVVRDDLPKLKEQIISLLEGAQTTQIR